MKGGDTEGQDRERTQEERAGDGDAGHDQGERHGDAAGRQR